MDICGCSNGVPGGIRTHDLRIRNPTLYPAELPGPTDVSDVYWSKSGVKDVWFALHPVTSSKMVSLPSLLYHQLARNDPAYFIVRVSVGRIGGTSTIVPGENIEETLASESLFYLFGIGNTCRNKFNRFSF